MTIPFQPKTTTRMGDSKYRYPTPFLVLCFLATAAAASSSSSASSSTGQHHPLTSSSSSLCDKRRTAFLNHQTQLDRIPSRRNPLVYHHHHHHHHHSDNHRLFVLFRAPLLQLRPSQPSSSSSPFQHPYRTKHPTTPLFQTPNHNHNHNRSQSSHPSSSTATPAPSSPPKETRVVYQKVLRSTTQRRPSDFLPSLLSYLQTGFELPRDLPMPYSVLSPNDDDDDGEQEEEDGTNSGYSVLSIDSPLSRDPIQTRLDIEVVGIYPDHNNDPNHTPGGGGVVLPTMAMVVVHKSKPSLDSPHGTSSSNHETITSRLFQDSETKLLQALERGLDDFEEGRVFVSPPPPSSSSSTSFEASGEKTKPTVGIPSILQAINEQPDATERTPNEETEEWTMDDFESLDDHVEKLHRMIHDGEMDDSDNTANRHGIVDTVATDVIETDATATTTTTTVNTEQPSSSSSSLVTNPSDATPLSQPPPVTEDFAVSAAVRAAATRHNPTPTPSSSSSSTTTTVTIESTSTTTTEHKDGCGEYAVAAAKAKSKSEANRNTTEEQTVVNHPGGFAVAAATAAAAARTKSGTNPKPKNGRKRNERDVTVIGGSGYATSPPPTTPTTPTQPTPTGTDGILDNLPNTLPLGTRNKPGQFRFRISSPERVKRRSSVSSPLKRNPKTTTTTTAEVSSNQPSDGVVVVASPTDSMETTAASVSATTTTQEEEQTIDGTRSGIDRVVDASSSSPNEPSSSSSSPTSSKTGQTTNELPNTKTDQEIEQDILNAAVELMPGFLPDQPNSPSSQPSTIGNGDMTPEELLADVLKFGDERKKEDMENAGGFAVGVFEETKEIMQEAEKRRDGEERRPPMKEVRYKEKEDGDGTSSVEEELKRIFTAGESIAESRMTQSTAATATEDDADRRSKLSSPSPAIDYDASTQALIDADTTVSRNVRTLDDELAELEVRISRSVDEPDPSSNPTNSNNPLFDVFSGPEVYNPNVDPETAVNWPGALPGTRTDVRMPPELALAAKNARFAADLLSKMALIDDESNDVTEERRYSLNGKEISPKQIRSLRMCVDEGVAVGLIRDPMVYLEERGRLRMVVDEIKRQPEERFDDIVVNYRDLVLSDNFVPLIRHRLREMDTELRREAIDRPDLDVEDDEGEHIPSPFEEELELERQILSGLVNYAQYLLKESQALGAELEALQLSVVRSICSVAMNPSHTTEEETAVALTEAVRDMRPLLDENLIAYLKYAVSEEEARLERAGLVDDPEASKWLFVLRIVQRGIYRELEVGVRRYVDHISYVLRMETRKERRELLSKLIDVMPSMDIRPFVKVVDNIAASLGSSVRGEFEDENNILGGMTNAVLQLRRDVRDLLPPERMDEMAKEADEWASRQREKLLERRNMTMNRLKAASETERYEEDDERPGRFREVERMT